MSEEVGVTNADTEGAMPGLEVPNWCEGCAGCLALRKELQDKEAEHKRVWLAVKQRVISTDLLLKQNAEYKARYNAKAQDILKYRQKIEEASRQLASTERHCETLQMQLDSALKEMEPLKKRNRELEESQQKCRAEVEEARDRIRASEGLCQQYREVIKKFEDEEAAREANNSSEKKVSVAKLQEDLAKLKADLTSEKRKSRGLERELDRAKVMIDGLQEQNSRVPEEAGEPACIPVVTPAKQPRTSHVTRTRTPKRNQPPPESAMSCSNETSDEEEVDWSTVPNRGVLSPVRLLSPLSPLPPTPAPCRRDDRFSSSSDSSDDNSDMDDDADRIESELLGGTQSLPFSDTDIADEKVKEPPKLPPVKSNYRNGLHRPPALKQSPTVNVSKENGKAQVKRFPRDRVNCSSPQKLTRSQDRRGQKRPPLRRATKAKAALTEEEITPPIESTEAVVENDCRSWFGEVEDLSDSESDSCLEKEKDREIKAKNGGEEFASPPRMARLCSSATTESDNDTTEEKRKTRVKSEVPISPPTTKKTTGATPSRYPLRSRSGDSVKQGQNGDASFSPRKKNKSESDADDIGGKVNSPARSQYELRSRQDNNKTDKIDDRIEAENAEDKTIVVNKSNDTLQQQTAAKELLDMDKKDEKSVANKPVKNNGITEEESDKVEDVKPHNKEEKEVSSGHDKVCNSRAENNTTDSESNSKISSPPHVDLPAAPSVNKDPSNNAKAESDQEGTEKSRSDSPEFRRPLTRSLSHGGKVNPGSRRDSSSSEREGDVPPKRVARLKTKLVSPVAGPSSITRSRSSSSEKSHSDVDTKDNLLNPPNSNPTKRATRLQTKLVSPVAGPSSRTRSRSSSSEKSLSDVDMKAKPRNSNTPKRVTRLQTKLVSPVGGPSSRTRNRSSSSEKNLSDVDTKDNPPTRKATRLQTKLISPVAGPNSRTRNRSSSSEKSPSDVDRKDNPPKSNPPKRAARLQSKSLAGPSSRTRSRSLSSEKSLSDVDTKDNPTNPSNSNTPKRVTRLQTKLISPLSGPSSRTRKRSLSSEKGLSDVDTKDNSPKVGTPMGSKRESNMASLSSSEKMINRDAEQSVPKSVSSPKKSAKHLRTEDTSGDRDLQVTVSDKETCTAQRNVTSALDIAPQMVTEKPVPKAKPLNNSTSQISKEKAVVKSPKVCTTSKASKMLAMDKVAVVVLEPLEKTSQQRTASQRHVPEEQQSAEQSGKSCTGQVAATNNRVTVNIDKDTEKTPEIPDEANKKGSTGTNNNANQQVYQEVVTKADELSDGARQSSANDGSNQEGPKEEESACDTMEEGELSESETDVTDGVQGSAVSVQEHQGPAELCNRQPPSVSLPERESPQVSNRSNRSSLSTSPVSPLPPSPFESLALSPLPVSPLLLERPISPLPPSPWGRSASPSLSPSLPISPLRETPLPPVVSPLQRTPHGEDGMSQSVSSKDAASPNAENPAHPSPCVFRSIAPKGAVQVKPKANRGRGAARSLSMRGKDAPSQNSLNSSSKKRAILFVQSEKTAWRSGKKNTQAAQDKQKSATKANSRPTTLPIKPNSKQQPKTKPGKGTNAQIGQEKVNKGATCSQNGHAIAEETTTTPEKSSRQTVKQTEKERIPKGQSLTIQDEDKDKQTSEMSRLKEVDPDERIEEGKTKESSQVCDSETCAAEDVASSKDVPCVSGTSKRNLEEDVEDGEITGDESDEVVERRTVKKLRTEPRDKLTADHVLQYMNNMQGGATTGGAVNIIMEYLLQSEEARVDLFPKVKTMCETGNTKLPVMTTAEMAILGRVTYLAKFGQWEGLVSQVSRALYTEIRLNIRKEHLLATCRLYTGLCRLRGQLEQVRILVYDILREKLFFPVDRILTIVSVWPLVLQRSGSNLEAGPMSHVIELVVMSQDIAEDLKSCFRSLYQWKDVKDGDVNSMADRLVELLQRKETAALVNNTHRVKYPRLNPLMYETAKALELLGSHQGWKWTHDHLIQTLLLPLLQKWRDNKKAKSIKSTMPQGTVVAIMQVIGCVGRIGLAEDKSSVNQLQQVMIDLLNEAVKKPNSVPWGIQIAAASSLVQLSPGNPGHALSALQTWMNLSRPTQCVCPPLLQKNVETLANCCR